VHNCHCIIDCALRRVEVPPFRESSMKIEPRLPQLPSLGELLEHPRVKVLVERVNRSTLAQRAGGFLEEMRASLAERAGRVEMPTLTHLAERLARRLLGEPAAGGPVINATGLVLGDESLAAPLAEPALHAMVQLAGEYHRRDPLRRQATERGLSELTGGEAAFLASTFEGAVTLAAAATAGCRELVVVGDAGSVGPIDWRWVAARAGAALSYVAPAPSPSWAELGRGAATVLRSPEADDADSGVDLATVAAQAKSIEASLIDVAPIAGTISPQDHGYQSVATIGERLTAGADLVITDGAGLLGGPSSGIVVGRRELVERIAKHPLASLQEVDPLVIAALEAMLKLYREAAPAPPIFQLPVWQLLSAPLGNLEQRAARIAALMGESSAIASAQASSVESAWRRWGARKWSAKSWAVELKPADGDPAALADQLARGPYSIAACQADGAVLLNLRTVFPRWDQQLVAAVDAFSRGGQTPSK
jgi:L-seryl-tRNA(Ser) seleniumtransferase